MESADEGDAKNKPNLWGMLRRVVNARVARLLLKHSIRVLVNMCTYVVCAIWFIAESTAGYHGLARTWTTPRMPGQILSIRETFGSTHMQCWGYTRGGTPDGRPPAIFQMGEAVGSSNAALAVLRKVGGVGVACGYDVRRPPFMRGLLCLSSVGTRVRAGVSLTAHAPF